MGTNYDPRLPDLFIYSNEADLIQRLLTNNEKKLTQSFNFTFRYLDDVICATCGADTAYPCGAPEFTNCIYWGSCYSIFSFMCVFCRSLFVLLSFFLLTIVLSVLLRYTYSDYPFGSFKLFLSIKNSSMLMRSVSMDCLVVLECYFFTTFPKTKYTCAVRLRRLHLSWNQALVVMYRNFSY